MPNFQKNIQGDNAGRVGINREGDAVQADLHVDGEIQIGDDFGAGTAVKLRRNPTTGRLQKNEGAGWQDLSGGGGGLPEPLEMIASFTGVYLLVQTPKARTSGPINPQKAMLPLVSPQPLYTPTPLPVQSAPLQGITQEA